MPGNLDFFRILCTEYIFKSDLMKTIISILLVCSGFIVYGQSIPGDSLYLGQIRPGKIPQKFAPGKVSLPGRNEAVITFSPNGEHVFFYVQNAAPYTLYSSYENDHWTTIDTIPFSFGRLTGEPIFSPDGKKVYMFATNAVNSQGIADLSYSSLINGNWTDPVSMGNPPNEENYQYHPCIVADTSVYFSSGDGDICRSQFNAGGYQNRVVLPKPVNHMSSPTWGDPWVAPDESVLIMKSIRPGGFGQNDLYISYRKPDGNWTNPKNLGNIINTSGDETSGDITPDGLYMTYGSNKDLYWVSASFIDSLRLTNYQPWVQYLIANQTDTINQMFQFTVPDTLFVDDDVNQELTYSAMLSNGNPLPDWLSFDTLNRIFSGNPPLPGVWNIRITATDPEGASAQTTFKITMIEAFAIEENPDGGDGILVFPNPVRRGLRVELLLHPGKPALLELWNSQGVMLNSQTFSWFTDLKMEEFPSGLYHLIIKQGDWIRHRKILKIP